MSSYAIRPMKVTEILDQGIRLFREHAGVILGAGVAIQVPALIALNLFVHLFFTPHFPPDATPAQMQAILARSAFTLAGVGIISMFVSLLVFSVAEGAVCYATAEFYLGGNPTIGDSIRFGLSRATPLIGTGILKGLIILIGLLLFIIPGIYFMLRYALASYVVILEESSGMPALRRSKEIMSHKGHIGQLAGLGIILIIVSVISSSILGLLGQGLIQSIVQVVINSVVTSASSAIMVVYYFSSRSRSEGFDLQLLADSFGKSNDEASPRVEY